MDILEKSCTVKPRVIVRVRSSAWADSKGIHFRKDILYLKRQCVGHNFIDEDCSMIDPIEVFGKITNINECEDGVYEVRLVNLSTDWETGIVDDWDYKLVRLDGE